MPKRQAGEAQVEVEVKVKTLEIEDSYLTADVADDADMSRAKSKGRRQSAKSKMAVGGERPL
jgi:hypothetical protein